MKKLFILTAILAFSIYFPAYAPVHAQSQISGTGNPQPSITGSGAPQTQLFPTLTNPLKADSVEAVILLVVDIAVYIGVIFAAIMIIYSGFKFIAARGNPDGLKEARNLFFAVIIGLAILIAAKAIVEIVKNSLIKAKVVDEKAFQKPN